jgi:hypothetical protein
MSVGTQHKAGNGGKGGKSPPYDGQGAIEWLDDKLCLEGKFELKVVKQFYLSVKGFKYSGATVGQLPKKNEFMLAWHETNNLKDSYAMPVGLYSGPQDDLVRIGYIPKTFMQGQWTNEQLCKKVFLSRRDENTDYALVGQLWFGKVKWGKFGQFFDNQTMFYVIKMTEKGTQL